MTETSEVGVADVEAAEVRKIVVGIDGSEHSVRALRWAAGEAALRGIELHMVTCWTYPPALAILPLDVDPWNSHDFHRNATAVLHAAVEKAGLDAAEFPWLADVRCGPAAQVLVELSGHAELMVVASRGLGGFKGLLLGSVSQQVVAHAACPVVVVH